MSAFVADVFAMPSQSLDPNRKRANQSFLSRRNRIKKATKYPYATTPNKIHGPTTTA